MFKNYTINHITLPLDVEYYTPETDVAFAVQSLVERSLSALQLNRTTAGASSLSSQNDVENSSLFLHTTCFFMVERSNFY